MSVDLRQQLRELGEFQRSTRTPVDPGELELVTLVRPIRPAHQRLRGVWVAAAAMAVVLLLIGGVMLVVNIAEPERVPPAGIVTSTSLGVPTTASSQQEPEVEIAPSTAVPDVVTVIPPQPLPPQTATALDAGRLNWRSPNLGDVPGLGDVVSTVILGPVGGQHLVVVEEAEGVIEDELLVSEDGVEFSRREEASFLVGGGDATDVVVGADILWLSPFGGSTALYRSTDGVTWVEVEFTGTRPITIEAVKNGIEQPIVRRGATIVTALGSRIFTSTDDGHTFVELGPFGELESHRFLTVGAISEEFFAVAARGEDRVQIARSNDGLNWTVHSPSIDLGVSMDDAAYLGPVSGDDPSLFLVTDVRGPHVFKYSRNGTEIRIDEVAALDANLIAELGLHSPDGSVLYGISAHHWQGRFVLRREGPRWALFVSDDGVDWGSITLGGVFDGGKPFFSNGLVFVRGGDVLAITEVALD
jgi:hypothetical protein